jgi:hypothetical protein
MARINFVSEEKLIVFNCIVHCRGRAFFTPSNVIPTGLPFDALSNENALQADSISF